MLLHTVHKDTQTERERKRDKFLDIHFLQCRPRPGHDVVSLRRELDRADTVRLDVCQLEVLVRVQILEIGEHLCRLRSTQCTKTDGAANYIVWRRTDPILASIFNGDVTIKNGGENWVCATPDYKLQGFSHLFDVFLNAG